MFKINKRLMTYGQEYIQLQTTISVQTRPKIKLKSNI